MDEEPAEVIGLEQRSERYEAVLLDPEPRPVIRHPDIYRTRRAHVPTAPAARSTPIHFDGESKQIAVPGDERSAFFAWMLVLGALAVAAHYLVL